MTLPPELVEVERPIPPELFADRGVPDITLPPNPTDRDVARVINSLAQSLMEYRCRLNEAGTALKVQKILAICAQRDIP